MAHLAQTKLLRTLILPLAVTVLSFAPARAEEERPPVEFAPGSTGEIDIPLGRMIRDAEEKGEALARDLTVQPPAETGIDPADLARMTEEALNHPVARGLLGVDETDAMAAGTREELYAETRAILFASFSMPAPVLRQMMQEAARFRIPVVFRGFVNSSVFDTRVRLEQVFEGAENAEGFAIDPTVFTRFKIEAVPALVVLTAGLDVCQTPGCAEDAPPLHDVLRGNIPTEAALRIISLGHGEAASVAAEILSGVPAAAPWVAPSGAGEAAE